VHEEGKEGKIEGKCRSAGLCSRAPARARRSSSVSNQLVSVDRRADYTLNGEPR
jgi:hypothetical protein